MLDLCHLVKSVLVSSRFIFVVYSICILDMLYTFFTNMSKVRLSVVLRAFAAKNPSFCLFYRNTHFKHGVLKECISHYKNVRLCAF